MFVQCNRDQAMSECAIMHTKGWLFCWFVAENTSVTFAQGLVESLQKVSVYDTLGDSEDVLVSSPIYTQGDSSTSFIVGCNPASCDGVSAFNKVLEWAKLRSLSLVFAPNIPATDKHTQRLLLELGAAQARSFSALEKGPSSPLERDRVAQPQHDGRNDTSKQPSEHISLWNRLFHCGKRPRRNELREAVGSRDCSTIPDLLLVLYNRAPADRDRFIDSVLRNLHIATGPETQIAAHLTDSAGTLETAMAYAVAIGGRYLAERSLKLQTDRTICEHFSVSSSLEHVEGHAFAIFGA